MIKYLITLFVLVVLSGCSRLPEEKIIAKINNYEITLTEFEQKFKESSYSGDTSLDSKRKFLDQLISRKLILQDAEKRKLDRDPNFLKMIENFWEHSLIRLALDQKYKENEISTFTNENLIKKEYQRLLRNGKTDKTYKEMYEQIKWSLIKTEEVKCVERWMKELHENCEIRINYEILE